MLDRVMESEFLKTMNIFDEYVNKTKNDSVKLELERQRAFSTMMMEDEQAHLKILQGSLEE